MKRTTTRHALRNALDSVRLAYSEGDAGQLHDAYVNAGKMSRLLRVVLLLFEQFYPVRRTLAFAAKLESCIAEYGFHEGCERFFQGLSIPRVHDLPESIRDIAEKAPVIFFGNHPSLFTPFLAAASVDRSDFRFFSTKYVCNLLPSVGAASFPMEVPLTRSWTEWRRGGWQRVVIYRLISLLHDMPPAEEIRAMNRASLVAGADYIRQGGSAIICPGGGGKEKDRRWYAGIGSLVKQLQESQGDRTVYLLPFREENCSNKRIYAYIQRGPISRLKNAIIYRRPVRIRFGNPIPIDEIGGAELTVQQVVDYLKAYYESLFLEPAIASI